MEDTNYGEPYCDSAEDSCTDAALVYVRLTAIEKQLTTLTQMMHGLKECRNCGVNPTMIREDFGGPKFGSIPERGSRVEVLPGGDDHKVSYWFDGTTSNVQKYLDKIKTEIRSKRITKTGPTTDKPYDPNSITEDYFFSQPSEGNIPAMHSYADTGGSYRTTKAYDTHKDKVQTQSALYGQLVESARDRTSAYKRSVDYYDNMILIDVKKQANEEYGPLTFSSSKIRTGDIIGTGPLPGNLTINQPSEDYTFVSNYDPCSVSKIREARTSVAESAYDRAMRVVK